MAKSLLNKKKIMDRLTKRMEERLDRAAAHTAKRIKRELSRHKSPPESSPGSPPGMLTGTLESLITVWKGRGRAGRLERYIGIRNYKKTAPYAMVHEAYPYKETTITTKAKDWLTIPISDQAKAHAMRGGGAREFPAPLHFENYGEEVFLVEDITSIRHYLLRKEVTIPARPYLRPGLKKARRGIRKIMKGK